MLLRLFLHWVNKYWGGQSRKAQPLASRKGAWGSSFNRMAQEVAIVPMRMQQFVSRVEDLVERLLRLQLPGDTTSSAVAKRDLEGLLVLMQGAGDQGRGVGDRLVYSKRIFRAEVGLLRMLLASSFCESVLVGRRFMDRLRGPERKGKGKADGAGPKVAKLGGVGGGETGEDEEDDGDAEAESCTEMALEGSGDEEEEEEKVDDMLGDEDDESWDEEEKEEEELEEEEEEDEEELLEEEIDEDEESVEAETVKDKVGWFETRNEMLDAVNSLPKRGVKIRGRVVLAELKGKAKDSGNKGAPSGALPMDKVPDVIGKLCGQAPLYVTRAGSKSKFAAVLFPTEKKQDEASAGRLTEAKPPVLDSAAIDASVCFSFGGGRSLFEVDSDVVARPTSPYMLGFFLPQRNSVKEEAKQRQVKALLDPRGPVGFPCHVSSGADFVCAAAGMQLTESMASVRVAGATVLQAAELVYALAAASPEQCGLAFQVENVPNAASRWEQLIVEEEEEEEEAQGRVDKRFITAFRLNGWEVSLTAGDCCGLPAAPVFRTLGRVRQALRDALRVDQEVGSDSNDASESDGTPKQPRRRRLKGPGRKHGQPGEAARALVGTVEAVLAQRPPPEARPKKRKKGKNPLRKPWTEAILVGDPEGHVDFLRPLEFVEKVPREKKVQVDEVHPYECPVCRQTFRNVKACKKHLKKTGHLELERGVSWKTIVELHCLRQSRTSSFPKPPEAQGSWKLGVLLRARLREATGKGEDP